MGDVAGIVIWVIFVILLICVLVEWYKCGHTK